MYIFLFLRSILSVSGKVSTGVSGVSMEPTLIASETICVLVGDYKLGDVFVFPYKYSGMFVHRYVGEQYGCTLYNMRGTLFDWRISTQKQF